MHNSRLLQGIQLHHLFTISNAHLFYFIQVYYKTGVAELQLASCMWLFEPLYAAL